MSKHETGFFTSSRAGERLDMSSFDVLSTRKPRIETAVGLIARIYSWIPLRHAISSVTSNASRGSLRAFDPRAQV
jgi:hypothetical protein